MRELKREESTTQFTLHAIVLTMQEFTSTTLRTQRLFPNLIFELIAVRYVMPKLASQWPLGTGVCVSGVSHVGVGRDRAGRDGACMRCGRVRDLYRYLRGA